MKDKATRATIELTVKDIKLDTIHDFIKQIGDLNGCTGCGLVGIDIRFIGEEIAGPLPDPWIANDIRLDSFEGLTGAHITEVTEIASFNR